MTLCTAATSRLQSTCTQRRKHKHDAGTNRGVGIRTKTTMNHIDVLKTKPRDPAGTQDVHPLDFTISDDTYGLRTPKSFPQSDQAYFSVYSKACPQSMYCRSIYHHRLEPKRSDPMTHHIIFRCALVEFGEYIPARMMKLGPVRI